MKHTRIVWALAGLTVFVAACGKKPYKNMTENRLRAPQNFWVMTAPDGDASSYMGNFFSGDSSVIDETAAMQLVCSKYIGTVVTETSGVHQDELYNASTNAASRIGLPQLPVATVDMEFGSTQIVRASYDVTGKMKAEIADDDLEAFQLCCLDAPDQCGKWYIAEAIQGTGALWYQTGREYVGDGNVGLPQVGGSLDVNRGYEWSRATEFTEPVYFSFKLRENPYFPEEFETCGDWKNSPPRSAQGEYFVGVSDNLPSERVARDAAMQHSRQQTVQYLGEQISVGSTTAQVTSGALQNLATSLESAEVVETAAAGVASFVKDRSWCVEEVETPNGVFYKATVLAVLPKYSIESAKQAMIEAVAPEAVSE